MKKCPGYCIFPSLPLPPPPFHPHLSLRAAPAPTFEGSGPCGPLNFYEFRGFQSGWKPHLIKGKPGSGEKCRNPAPGIALREAILNHKIRRPFFDTRRNPDARGSGHVGLCRTTVSFDTALSGDLAHDSCQMPPASLNRCWWHLLVLQTTCSVLGARGLQVFMAIGAPCAPWPIVRSSARMSTHDLQLGAWLHWAGLGEVLQTAIGSLKNLA